MTIISHAVYPVLLAQSVNIIRNQRNKESIFQWKQLCLIGICGGLPDLLSPHLSLDARYSSVSHSLLFVLLSGIISIILALKIPRYRKLAYFCFFAAVFHLLCDMFAGGINLFGPFGRRVIGRHYISFHYWIPFDIIGIMFLFVAFFYHKSTVRMRHVVLVSGFMIAVCGTVLVLSNFGSEALFLKRISAAKINTAQLQQAQRAWNSLMAQCQDGTFEPLSSEFADRMKNALTPQSQKQLFQDLESVWGNYRKITFIEAKTGRFYYPRLIAYRFQGNFSKMNHPTEIDIIFDYNGKISGISLKDNWKDRYFQ